MTPKLKSVLLRFCKTFAACFGAMFISAAIPLVSGKPADIELLVVLPQLLHLAEVSAIAGLILAGEKALTWQDVVS